MSSWFVMINNACHLKLLTLPLLKKELTKNEETSSHSNDNFDCSNQSSIEIKGLNSVVQEEENSSIIKLLEALLAGIIAGLIALVTPCVFYDSINC